MSNNQGVWCSKCYGDHYANDCPDPVAPVEANYTNLSNSSPVEANGKLCPYCKEIRERCEDNEYCQYRWPPPTPSTPAPGLYEIGKNMNIEEKECGNCGHPRHTDDPNWQCKECLSENKLANRPIDQVCAAYCPTTDDDYVRSVFPDAWEAPYSRWIWTREPQDSDTATDRPTCLSTEGWRIAAQYVRSNPVAEPKPTPSTPAGWWCEDCQRFVGPEEVTFEETHDVRVGGCGMPVGSKELTLKPQPGSSSIPEIELELRRIMWLGHGHTGMYGDDGEMQCMECQPYGVVDYKGEPLDKVRETFRAVQMERMMKPRDSSSISTEQTFEEWWATDPVWSTPSSLARLAWNAAKGQSDGR